ncbi:MAG: gamma-glutamyltransferase [Halofilum sp. (in: g-proteobacteria)]
MAQTTRPTFLATNGMVSSPHYLASAAGLGVLQDGGTAVDAVIAVNAALGVVYPHMTGMGGDAFWLIHDSASGRTHALNGSGRAAAAALPKFYYQQRHEAIPSRGPLSAVTVPGAVDSWCEAHAHFGHLALTRILEPAIRYAREGYPVSVGQSEFTRATAESLQQHAATRNTFMPEGRIPEPGEIMRLPRLAETMEAVAQSGRAGFYEGAVAADIVRSLLAAGGLWGPRDLSEHASTWEWPLASDYRGYTCYQHPPNSQGFAHQMILNILEQFDVARMDDHSAEYVHLVVEATKLAFRDRDRYLTDPDALDIPLERLLSKDYAAELKQEVSASAQFPRATAMGQDTTCTVAVDRWGNAVSMIQSLYHEFGSCFVTDESGVLLQNRGSFFSLDEAHVNCLAPGKRTFHTLMPGMLFKDGRPELVYGTMGGEGQPQTSTVLVNRYVDFQQGVQTAIDRPRWLFGRMWGENTQALRIESRFPTQSVDALMTRGHEVEVLEPWSAVVGHAAAIRIDRANGVFGGGADPRGEGVALGW